MSDNIKLRHTLELVLFVATVCIGLATATLLYVYHDRIWPSSSGNNSPVGPQSPNWGQYEDDTGHWNYDDASGGGPSHWGSLVNASTGELLYPLCADRPNGQQSPIAIDDASGDVILENEITFLERNYSVWGHYTLVPRPGGHPGFMVRR